MLTPIVVPAVYLIFDKIAAYIGNMQAKKSKPKRMVCSVVNEMKNIDCVPPLHRKPVIQFDHEYVTGLIVEQRFGVL
jgi:hypothetical protein